MTMITLSLNNEKLSLEAKTPLSVALEKWGFGDAKVAVAVNGEFVPRSRHPDYILSDNDLVDVVKPVGGG